MLSEANIKGLEKALEHSEGTHTVGDVVAQILEGEAQLWLDDEAVVVTEVLDTPQKRIVNFWLVTGEKSATVRLHRRILEWAKNEMGCTLATMMGRRGWEQVLASEGWSFNAVVLSKEL